MHAVPPDAGSARVAPGKHDAVLDPVLDPVLDHDRWHGGNMDSNMSSTSGRNLGNKLGGYRAAPPLAQLLALALCYALVARASLLLGFAHTNATPLWPPSGMALAAVVLLGYRCWPAITLGAFVANLAAFYSHGVAPGATMVAGAAAIAGGNTLEALAGAWLLRRYTDTSQPLGQLQNVYKFALVAMLMCAISAGIGATTLLVTALAPAGSFGVVLLTWWVGDTAGVLLVAPAIVIWRLYPRPRPGWRATLEVAVSLALLLACVKAIFFRSYAGIDYLGWLPYLLVPCVAWAAFRYGLRGASSTCLLVAGGAVLATINGHGPFVAGTLNDALIALDTFVVLCSLIGLVLCADAAERRRLQARVLEHSAVQWATLLLGVALTVLVWHLVSLGTERRAREHFEADSNDITERIGRRIALYEAGLRAAQALFQAEQAPSRAQWRDFAAAMDLQRNLPGVMGLGYGAAVRSGQHAAFEAQVHADGYPDFRIWSRKDSAALPADTAAPATIAVPVYYLEPFEGRNQLAFGYDMMSEPVRRKALLNAARSGQPALTQKVVLIQDADGVSQPGFLVYFPVYRKQAKLRPDATPSQRLAALQGYAYSPIRAQDLMQGLLGTGAHGVRLEIFDGNTTALAARLYASTPDRSEADRLQYPNPYQRLTTLDLLQHRWTLRFTSLPAFERAIDRQKSHIVLLAGVIISLLFFGVVRALTARHVYATGLARQMTGALRESQASLIVARDEAEAASRAKSDFVANMSHEIRTPLNAVLGMAQLLGKTTLAPVQQQYVDMIRTSGQSLLAIVNDVLDFSKIEAGRMELAPAPFVLADVLTAVSTITTVNIGNKALAVRVGSDADVPQQLVGDALRLQQVLVNLVGNAIKFTERGSVTLRVQRLPAAGDAGDIDDHGEHGEHGKAGETEGTEGVEGTAGTGAISLRFTITDTGIGIAPDHLAQLFAPFSQADASMTRRFGGTGLGLAISRRIATLMGGAITVQSTPGVGSCFALTVPLHMAHSASGAAVADVVADLVDKEVADEVAGVADRLKAGTASGMAAGAPAGVATDVSTGAAPVLAGVRLLLVEDNPINQLVARGMLAHAGAQVDTVDHGRAAVERLRSDGRYDLVLMDVQMPEMDGFEATRLIRTELALHLPVLAMSAGVLASERAQCLACGMNDFIAKPVDADELLATICRHLPATRAPADS